MPLGRSIAHVCLLVLVCWLAPLRGQGLASGTIEGRVYNPATGAFLEGVRLKVEGTSIESSTDADGNYRLQQVPAGSAKVSAFFTGTGLQTHTVEVVAGRTSQRDFQLSPSSGKRAAGVEGEARVGVARAVWRQGGHLGSRALEPQPLPQRAHRCLPSKART